MSKEESKAWIDAAVKKGNEAERLMEEKAKDQMASLLKEYGLVTKEELELLTKRIEALEQQRH
ncbi:hypothetical protein D3C71_2072140 [compost metagenome]